MFSCAETERMAHLVADLRAAQAGHRDQLRAVSGGKIVKTIGVIGEKNPVGLRGMRDELDVGGEFPLAQAVQIGIGLGGGEGIGEFIRHDAAGPGNVGGRGAGKKITRRRGQANDHEGKDRQMQEKPMHRTAFW